MSEADKRADIDRVDLGSLPDCLRREDAGTEVWACLVDRGQPSFQALERAEAQVFPEAPELFAGADCPFAFLTVVSVPERLALHAMRLSLPDRSRPGARPLLVDDLVGSGQGLTMADFDRWAAARGVTMADCTSVESNFRLAKVKHVPSAAIAYVAMFHLVHDLGYVGGIFAHLNRAARVSFRRAGLGFEPVLGREGLRTPGVGVGFDPSYEPVFIPLGGSNAEAIASMADDATGIWVCAEGRRVMPGAFPA
jgi:hypothetical protein